MIRYSSLFFVLSFVGALHAADKISLADYLTYRVPRTVSLEVFKGVAKVIEENEKLTEYSTTKMDVDGQKWGGKTALHELLLKFSTIKEDGAEFDATRRDLIAQLLTKLAPDQAHELIQKETKTSKATPKAIIAFYGSDERAQYLYTEGEQEKLLALLKQYDQPTSVDAEDAAMNDA